MINDRDGKEKGKKRKTKYGKKSGAEKSQKPGGMPKKRATVSAKTSTGIFTFLRRVLIHKEDKGDKAVMLGFLCQSEIWTNKKGEGEGKHEWE